MKTLNRFSSPIVVRPVVMPCASAKTAWIALFSGSTYTIKEVELEWMNWRYRGETIYMGAKFEIAGCILVSDPRESIFGQFTQVRKCIVHL